MESSDISAYAGFEPKPVFTDHLACKWEWRYSSFSYYVLLLMYHCYYDKWLFAHKLQMGNTLWRFREF